MEKRKDIDLDIEEFGNLLLEIGTTLMCSGASAARTRMIIDRIAEAYHMKADLFITHRALSLTVIDPQSKNNYSRIKRSPPQGVNYTVVSGISRMSWSIRENNWSLQQIGNELSRLKSAPRYNRLITLSAVGVADAGFCYFIDGTLPAMLVSFLATFVGLFVRQEAHQFKFNPYLCIFLASSAATLVAGGFRFFSPEGGFETAFSSCVLFLIPGVPMINAFTDLIDGNILNGIIRGMNGLIMAFMIALGMILSITIYNF